MVAIIIPGRNGPLVAGGTAASGAVWSTKSTNTTLSGTPVLTQSSTNSGVGEGAYTDLSHITTGKYYAGFTYTTLVNRISVGIANASWPINGIAGITDTHRPGNADFDSCGVDQDGNFWVAGGSTSILTGGMAQGDTVDIAFDIAALKFWVRKNNLGWNTALGTFTSSDVASGNGYISMSGINAGPYFICGYILSGGQIDAQFGSFSRTPPTNFIAY